MVGFAVALPFLAALPLAASLRIDGAQSPEAGNFNWTSLFAHCGKLQREIQELLGRYVDDRSDNYLRLLQTGQSVETSNRTTYLLKHRKQNKTKPSNALGDAEVMVSYLFENTAWTDQLRAKGMPVTLREAEGGDETIAYVKHLIASYDSNKSMTVLLHGDAPGAAEMPDNLVEYLSQVDPLLVQAYGGYASLSFPYHRKLNSSQHKLLEYRMDCGWRDDLWVKLLKKRWNLPEFGGFSGNDGRYCCSQFIVTRQAVQSYPKEFYESMLERVSKDQPWDVSSWKAIAKTMATLWHIIYTGKIDEQRYNFQRIARCPPEGCAATPKRNAYMSRAPGPGH